MVGVEVLATRDDKLVEQPPGRVVPSAIRGHAWILPELAPPRSSAALSSPARSACGCWVIPVTHIRASRSRGLALDTS
jgi:hypothetical protein